MGFWSDFVKTIVEVSPHLAEIAQVIISKFNGLVDLPEIERQDLEYSITNLCSKLEVMDPGISDRAMGMIAEDRLSDAAMMILASIGKVHKKVILSEGPKAIEAIFDEDADEAEPTRDVQKLLAMVTPSSVFFPGVNSKNQVLDIGNATDAIEDYDRGLEYLRAFLECVPVEYTRFQKGLVSTGDPFAPELHEEVQGLRITSADHMTNDQFLKIFGIPASSSVVSLLNTKAGLKNHYGSASMAEKCLPSKSGYLQMVYRLRFDFQNIAPTQKTKYWNSILGADPSILADLEYYSEFYWNPSLKDGIEKLIKICEVLRSSHYFSSMSHGNEGKIKNV